MQEAIKLCEETHTAETALKYHTSVWKPPLHLENQYTDNEYERYARERGGQGDIWVKDPDTGLKKRHTEFKGYGPGAQPKRGQVGQ